jgi:rare lipoprotein A
MNGLDIRAENSSLLRSLLNRVQPPVSATGWFILLLLVSAGQGCALVSGPPHSTASGVQRSSKIEIQQGTIIKASDKAQNLQTAPVASTHTGEASWYGPGFNGKKTASGEIFDDGKFTAAHKSLPLGSKARVTNISTGESVEVEINDRGPFVNGRIIDLSHAAAKALGMIDSGIALVRIELISEPPKSADGRGQN